MGWNDVNKGALGQSSGRFLSLTDGETKTIRLLDEEPESAYVHKISQIVNGQEVFRSIPATVDLDDNFIQNNSNRWPATPTHGMRCIEIQDGEAVGDIMVLTGGRQIYGDLKLLFDRYGDLRQFDIDIHREGEGRDTKYSVTLAPKHAEINLEELIEEIEQDPALQWDAVFPKINGEQQQRMLSDANLDIGYDPAEDLAAEMAIEEALSTRMSTGKYEGKQMRELMVVDIGYLNWVADKFTSDDSVAAAARVVVRNMEQIAQPKAKAGLGTGKAAPASAAAKPAGKRSGSKASTPKAAPDGDPAVRNSLVNEINEILAGDTQYEDAMVVAATLRKYGNEKTRIRDFTVEELTALRDGINPTSRRGGTPPTCRQVVRSGSESSGSTN
jgi:hypothetical protein